MIRVQNRVTSIPFNTKKFKEDAQHILDALKYADFDLGILLTTNKTIHHYNKMYRDKDKPTDVLSFPFYPELKAGEKIRTCCNDDKILGDIIISLEYVKKDAPHWNQTFEQRMQVMLVHGICHLLGYDHITDEDYAIMKRKETALLKKLIHYF
jgi:rRNA maturation RNase YbeY